MGTQRFLHGDKVLLGGEEHVVLDGPWYEEDDPTPFYRLRCPGPESFMMGLASDLKPAKRWEPWPGTHRAVGDRLVMEGVAWERRID